MKQVEDKAARALAVSLAARGGFDDQFKFFRLVGAIVTVVHKDVVTRSRHVIVSTIECLDMRVPINGTSS